jgi:hypothetical protein
MAELWLVLIQKSKKEHERRLVLIYERYMGYVMGLL